MLLETKSIKGRVCYRDNCNSCKKDRGFVPKSRIGKLCKSCSNSLNKKGKPSPLKGTKTGKPAWNRGEFFHNKEKYILKKRMSRRMRHALSGRNLSKKWVHIFDMLGYSACDLKARLESQFKDGMSWGNIGKWHIDHIHPESKFNYNSTDCDQFKKCWSLENLQPLWAKDNQSKSNKVEVCHPTGCK
jgi:hypothetical protein